MSLKSINPLTGELIAEYVEHNSADVEQILSRGVLAFGEWRKTALDERSAVLL